MDVGYVSIDSIISEWLDMTGHDGQFDTDFIYKCAQDELNKLGRGEQAQQYISMLNIEEYKAKLPPNFKSIAQVAINIFPERPCPRTEIVEWNQKLFDGSGCDLKINLECPSCHKQSCSCSTPVIEVNADEIWRRSNPQYATAHLKHFYSYTNMNEYPGDRFCNHHPQFKLIGRASNNYRNLKYHISECINLDLDTETTYDIDVPYMVVNQRNGQILLSYFGYRMDDKGRMMVPNLPEVFESVILYIERCVAYKEYRKSRKREDRLFYLESKQMYDMAHRVATNVLEMPSADKMNMILRNKMTKLLPYWNDVENLNRRQDDQFRYPGQRSGLIY